MNNKTQIAPSFFSVRQLSAVAMTAFAYLGLSALLVGFKTDQVFLVVVFALCYFLTPITRKLILGFSIFIVYWIIFDYMKVVPNYRVNDVHIQSLYEAEKHLFGMHVGGVLLTPNEYWQHFHRSFLDVASGIFYLTWVPVPLGFAAYLFFKNKKEFLYFSLTFLLVNLIGFVIYYVYPAAPPWYVAEHGFTFIRDTPGNTAGLSRFDAFFNTGIFKSIYEKSSNVFAAMPSLHSSYPLIVFYYGLRNRLGAINILFATLMLGIWFSAVYTSHHYVLDVIAGILCAITGIRLFLLMATKNKFIIKILDNYRTVIS